MSGFDGNGRRRLLEAVAAARREMSESGASGTAGPALTRRGLLRVGAGVAGATLIPGLGNIGWVYAADKPPIGTWPAGSQGGTVYIGAAVPLTGTYAVQGADELKGWELAVEHINTGHELMKKIAPKVDKGLLGKKVQLVSADSGAKPNQAVQAQQTFINQNKIVLMTGSTSSAVAVALNKFAQRGRTTPPARTACATASGRASTARPPPTRSARSW